MKSEIVYTKAGDRRLLLTPETSVDRDALVGSPDLLPARTTHNSDGYLVDVAYLFATPDIDVDQGDDE